MKKSGLGKGGTEGYGDTPMHESEGDPIKLDDAKTELVKNKKKIKRGPVKKKGILIPSRTAGGKSTLELEDALPGYLEEAERYLESDEVPPQYKERVRVYFDRLK
ncbi:MAG: hypothetical protein HY606_04070 [Planctomycetes bacterium]|nr:hypothetical protein [Planctomycetota bacterium]